MFLFAKKSMKERRERERGGGRQLCKSDLSRWKRLTHLLVCVFLFAKKSMKEGGGRGRDWASLTSVNGRG